MPEDIRQATQEQPFVTSDGTIKFVEALDALLPPAGSRTLTPPDPKNGASAKLCDGRFVTVRSKPAAGLFGRFLDASGQPLGPDFVVSPAEEGGTSPSVASTSDGGFVVSWLVPKDPPTIIAYARKFDTSGGRRFARVRISELGGENSAIYVVGLPSGQVAVLWHNRAGGTTRLFVRTLTENMKLEARPVTVAEGNIDHGYLRVQCDGTLVALWNTERGGRGYRGDAARVVGQTNESAPPAPLDLAELTKECDTTP